MERNTYILSVINAKGGVGKTTISANISHCLSYAGYKVLHVDLDPQGSSSELIKPLTPSGARLRKDDILRLDTFKLLSQPAITQEYIFKTEHEGLDIIPNARSVEQTMEEGSFDKKFEKLGYANKYTAFKTNLDKIRGLYDYVIIDGQPYMNDIMRICITASDCVLSPALPDMFNLHTVDETLKIIDLVNQKYKLDIQYLGFFFNQVDDLKDEAYLNVKKFYVSKAKEYFLDYPIRKSKVVLKAVNLRKLWIDYARDHTVIFPNPCKDLLKLLDNIGLLEPEHKEVLLNKGFKRSYFE